MIVTTTIIKGIDSFLSDAHSIGRFKICHSRIKAMTNPKISENKKAGSLVNSWAMNINIAVHSAKIKNKTPHRSKALHSNHSNFFKNPTGYQDIKLNKCNTFKLTVTSRDANKDVIKICTIKTPLFRLSMVN